MSARGYDKADPEARASGFFFTQVFQCVASESLYRHEVAERSDVYFMLIYRACNSLSFTKSTAKKLGIRPLGTTIKQTLKHAHQGFSLHRYSNALLQSRFYRHEVAERSDVYFMLIYRACNSLSFTNSTAKKLGIRPLGTTIKQTLKHAHQGFSLYRYSNALLQGCFIKGVRKT